MRNDWEAKKQRLKNLKMCSLVQSEIWITVYREETESEKKGIRMAKVCMKRSSISLVLEKKCYLKALHVPIGKAKKKKKNQWSLETASTGKDVAHPMKYKIEQSCWKVVPHEPATPPLDIYPSKTKTYFHTKPIWKGTWLLHS